MKNLKVSSIQRNTLSKQVLEQIVDMLMNGNLKSGDKLPPETELMVEFDVSRPVLREALSSLETLEIVHRKPRGGTYINDRIGNAPFKAMLALAINNVSAIIEARMILELGLVTIAAQKISEEEVNELRRLNNKIKNSKTNNYGKYDIEFHKLIAKSADNPVVEGLIDALLLVHERTDSLIPYREREKTVLFHEEIIESLAEKNPSKAHQAMLKHLEDVKKKLLSV